ncbi:MAG: T9SS type A sorting domain-containing protein [Gemmatimonadaceae bacterium]|nr:T9SS type A sorting domain-containing protein [Gemmatimonadaceae bacterium]
MQRRNYAALFAALVIGFGAIDAHAAEVRSVTITSPDSGATLGIDGTFQVRAVVRDFTPNDQDGVVIALIMGGAVLGDDATGGGKVKESPETRVPVEPTVADLNGGLGLTGDAALARQEAADVAGSGIVAVRIQKSNGNTDSTRYFGGDATSVSVDANVAEVTYIWNGKIHQTSGTFGGISAVAVAVDDSDGGTTVAVTPGTGGRSPTGKGNVLFAIDADRPPVLADLILVGGDGIGGDVVTALLNRRVETPPNTANDSRADIAGIGNVLEFDVKVGADNMSLILDKGHTVEIDVVNVTDGTTSPPTVGDKKKTYSVALETNRLDTLTFRQAIAEGDFGDLMGENEQVQTLNAAPVARNAAIAYLIDEWGNRSGTTPSGGPEGARESLAFLIDAKKPVIDGVGGKDVGAGDTLEVASPDTVTDGTLNSGTSNDGNPIQYRLWAAEKYKDLDIDLGGTVLKLKNEGTMVRRWGLDDGGNVVETVSGPGADGVLGTGGDDVPTAADTIVAFSDNDPALSDPNKIRLIFDVGAGDRVSSIQTTPDLTNLTSHDTTGVGVLKTGVKLVKVTGTDFAGNKGPAAERADVYVDVDDLAFNGLFPTEADITTIEETSTADVRFTLSEHADSVRIIYQYVSGRDRPGQKIRDLAGGELLDLEEQVIPHGEFINSARGDTGLVDDTKYNLSLIGADLAGNYKVTDAGDMTYDTNYVVPKITYFSVSSNPPGGTRTDDKGKLAGSGQVAAHKDPQFTVTVNAWNKDKVAALAYGKVNYNNDAVVTVSGGSGDGLTLSGKGVVTEGMPVGVARLTSDAWGVGRIGDVVSWKADVKVNAQKAPETHTVKVEDLTSDADTSFVGKLDSSLVIKHAAYKEIEISVNDTVYLHSLVEVGLRYIDAFGNTVLDTDNYVEVSTSVIGVELPPGALQVKDGVATFSVRSNSHLGALPLTIRNVTGSATVATKTVEVTEQPDPVGDDAGDDEVPPDRQGPDAPDQLVGEDYKGALGEGDQGGFVMLTFDLSDNHSTIDGYRIWRDVTVTQGVDDDGNVVELPAPTIKPVAWGSVDAIPGVDVMRVVVATLDGDATFYGVTAESSGLSSDATRTGGGDDGMMDDDGMDDDGMDDDGMDDDGMSDDDGMDDDGMDDDGGEDDGMEDDGAEDDGMEDDGMEDDGGEDTGEETGTDTTATDNKRAFTVAQSVSMPYELMAETMVRSREAARGNLEGPVFATLTPEALAFHERGGLVPSMKSVQGELTDHITRTEEAVRAIDDIAPAPVTWVRALDTPGDAGASITIEWTRSLDDRILTSVVPQAIGEGGNVFTSAGVEAYNVSRRIGDGAWQLVGEAPAGSSSWEDLTAANGVRYSYKVEPRDLEQVTASEIERSAMAIRNTVVDGDGNRIVGLFGADNRVDYDDFFIFADHFGLTAESDLYEAAFDIIPNDVIDVDDFFAFAESFGKEVAGIGKAVPTLAGLNSDARFYIDNAAAELPRVGEEMSLLVSLADFAEVRGYGFTVNFDSRYLEFVEPRFESNPLGEAGLAQPRVIANADGEIHIAAFGETVREGDLGVTLVFRSIEEIEESLVEVMAGGVQDGSYGLNRITDPVAIRVETRPEVYALENNFPNPFNPETTIKYQLPDANEVTLEVFNMLGQVVRTMVDREFQNAGRYSYQWDATNDSGQPLSSGIYFYRVTAGGEFQSHKKMLLLK